MQTILSFVPFRAIRRATAVLLASGVLLATAPGSLAQEDFGGGAGAARGAIDPASAGPTYADLVDLAERSQSVVHARITRQAEVSPERSPGLAPGSVRLYVEAETVGLLSGGAPLGQSLRYLVDLPRTTKGRAPKLKRDEVVLFARAVAGRPGELQLVRPDAQLPWSPELGDRLRPILAELAAPDRHPAVTGVRDALSVPGNLAGESETQVFLTTATGDPASITVVRRPGMEPRWGVSWTDIVDQSARPPQPETLGWYRLACALPAALPARANLGEDPALRQQAAEDYRYVRESLGPCRRTRGV